MKNVTITLTEETLHWARVKAAEKGTSVSKFVGQVLEERRTERPPAYWKAYEEWKKIKPVPMKVDIRSISREETHERGR